MLHLERFRPFAFAGIWTAIESRGIGWIRNFAIVTRPPEASIESIHDRMPAIVRSAEYDAWLDPETPVADAEHIALAKQHDIRSYAVSSYVNKPANDDEECISPLGQP